MSASSAAAHGAPGVEHVVDQHHDAPLHVGERARPRLAAQPARGEVVPVHRHVQGAGERAHALESLDLRGQPPGQRDAAAVDAGQHDVAHALVPLGDLVRHAGDGAADAVGVEQERARALGGGDRRRRGITHRGELRSGRGAPRGKKRTPSTDREGLMAAPAGAGAGGAQRWRRMLRPFPASPDRP